MGINPFFPTTKGVLGKLGGDIKKTATIAFNGDTNGKETFVDASEGLSLVKISNKVYDFSSVTKVVVHIRETAEEAKSQIGEIATADGISVITGAGGEGLAFSTDGTVESMSFLSPGTWVSFGDTSYVTRIEFAETIVPIDQKYLPGVCLPVVELSTTFTSGADLTEEEDKLLKAAWERNTPVVIKLPVSFDNTNSDMCAVWSRADHGGICNFTLPYGGKTLVLYSTDNAVSWGCTVQ